MKSESSLKCVRDLRDIPPTAYRLPDDGRQQRHLCEQRQRLMWLLASYADGDGTRVFPSAKTLANSLGVSRRTVTYLLADLRKLNFIENGGYHGESGPRIRAIKIEQIKGAGARSSSEQERNLGASGAQSSGSGAQSSGSGAQSSIAHDRHLTATETDQQTDQAACAGRTIGALPEWVGLLFSEFNNHAPLQLRKTDRDQFMAAIKQHGKQVIELAWNHFVHVGTYNTETKFPAYLFFKELGLYLEAARKEMQSASWRREHDPEYAAIVEANIQRQEREYWERMNRAPVPENGGSVNEYLAALEEVTAASNEGV